MGPSDVRTFVPNIRVSKSLRNGIQLVWLVEFAVLQLSVLGTLDAARIRYQYLSSTFGFGSHDGKARPHERHRGEGTLGPGCFPWNLHSYPEDSGGLAFEFLLSKLCICSQNARRVNWYEDQGVSEELWPGSAGLPWFGLNACTQTTRTDGLGQQHRSNT